MLIDYTYFGGTGLFCVANVDPAIITNEGNYTKLVAFINAFEPEICEMLMTKALYDALIVGLAVTPTPEQRWIDLAAQLRNATAKTSPIANYVYFKLWSQSFQQSTQGGDVVITGSNLEPSANKEKAALIWNQAVRQFEDFQEWLSDHLDDYPEWDGEDVYYLNCDDKINVLGI
ncbi:MAG TPA: hypothetical protein PKH58_10490 [Paludibacteraceae bacterium]|nr:hypothetical protein [Paludibacteraceae bacterium]